MNSLSIHRTIILILFFLLINLFAQDYWLNTENLPIPPEALRLGLDRYGGLYLSTEDKNTFYSDNGGQDWQHIKEGLQVIVFMADCTGYIYFGTDDGIYCSQGATTKWDEKNAGLIYYRNINDLVMDSKGYFYAVVGGDGIYRSIDKGNNWNFTSYTIPRDSEHIVVTLSTNYRDTIFAGTYGKGVFKSIDYGNNWYYTGMDGLNILCTLGLDNNFVLLGSRRYGIYRSENNGIDWHWSNSELPEESYGHYNQIKRLYQAKGGDVYLAMSGTGIYKSLNHGISWQLVSDHPVVWDIEDLLVDQEDNIIVCGSDGVHSSNNAGSSWNSLNNGLYSENIRIDDVFTGLQGKVFTLIGDEIFVSDDRGNNWSDWSHPAEGIAFIFVSADGTIYLIGSTGYRTDDGITWKRIEKPAWGYVTDICEGKDGVLYLSTRPEGPIMGMSFGGGIYQSTDSASTWIQIGQKGDYNAIAVNSQGQIFIGEGKGLFTSSDDGANWTEIATDDINVYTSDILIDKNDHLYVGTESGVFYSSSNGVDWEIINDGLETIDVKSIVQNSNEDIFICTGSQVYRYNREDKFWEKVSSGLSGEDLYKLTVSEDDYLYLAYRKNTIARSAFSTVTGLNNRIERSVASDYFMAQNYPNPFNQSTVISWQLAVGSDVELSVYNLLGQKVATLVSERQSAGYHSVTWDASGYASGVYYYRLEVNGPTGNFQQVRKMVLLR